MLTFDSYKNQATWRSEFGLLPVPLFRDTSEEQPLALFNGGHGNFCIDWGCFALGDETRNFSWSSNISHYVSVTPDKFEVQRWDQGRASVERYSFSSVANNFEKFHRYLEGSPAKQDQSIISHLIKVFRKIRATLGADISGENALSAFLYLLGSLADNVPRGQLDIDRWSLTENSLCITSQLRELDWENLCIETLAGRPAQGLRPVIDLLLRHASGQLFQDAHYEAAFINPGQLSFDGFLVNTVAVSAKVKSTGVHFTPPALARTVAEEVLRAATADRGLTIFDPACGSGEFLKEILRQLKLNRNLECVKLIGWDISPAACEMANFSLAIESRDISFPLEITIENKDSIFGANRWPQNVDIIIMNPPFVSWQDLKPSQRSALKSLLGEQQEKRSDLSHGFLWQASQSLCANGVLGTVIPASFFTNESSKMLRNKLKELMTPKLLVRLGSHQLFSNAIVDTAIYIGKKQQGISSPFVALWADHRAESSASGLRALRKLRVQDDLNSYPFIGDGYNIYLEDAVNTSISWSPRPYESIKMLSNTSGMPRVKELFEVRQGARTGQNKAYILSINEFNKLPRSEQQYFRPCVSNDSINCGYLIDSKYIFYPYGEQLLVSETELADKVPCYLEAYLYPEKDRLLARPRINPSKWWDFSEHRAWQKCREAKLISKYFGGRGAFAWDNTGDYVVVQGYAWIPKKHKLTDETAKAYLALLNSDLFYCLLSGVSNSVAGGQLDLSKRFVDQVPLPNLFEYYGSSSIIDELAKIGSRIHAGLTYDSMMLDNIVRVAYNVA